MEIDTAIVIWVGSFFAAILGSLVGNLVTARMAAAERKDARRKERANNLTKSLESLIHLRAKLQYLQIASMQEDKRLFRQQQEAYGEAYALMLSVDDRTIRSEAGQVMKGSHSGEVNEKLDAINAAIMRLGEMITEIMAVQ